MSRNEDNFDGSAVDIFCSRSFDCLCVGVYTCTTQQVLHVSICEYDDISVDLRIGGYPISMDLRVPNFKPFQTCTNEN